MQELASSFFIINIAVYLSALFFFTHRFRCQFTTTIALWLPQSVPVCTTGFDYRAIEILEFHTLYALTLPTDNISVLIQKRLAKLIF